MKRTVMGVIAVLIMTVQTVSASVLGTLNGGWQTDMGGGAVYSNNVFMSESVGNQSENYVEYTPNSEARPVVVNGESIYGTRTITNASKYMQDNNLRPLVGINGDFFSTKTGIPMGYTIIDGRIWSKENTPQDAIGFRKDGTAFIDELNIQTTLKSNANSINIQYINKWLQKGFSWVNLLDSNFGADTKTDFNALYVICSETDGKMSVNSELSLKVDEIFIYEGAIKIPDEKYVFVMDVNGDKTCYDFLSNLATGDRLILSNTVIGDTKNNWEEAEYAISTVGDRLIKDGEIGTDFEKGAAPRTAVGIKADGNIIFYTIDGRQAGHSYGARLDTLAERLYELGCTDAINLDGGGSTVIGGIFPGSGDFVVSNKPSDGRERRCANYLFLQDMRKRTDVVGYVNWAENTTGRFMSGVSHKIVANSVYDTANYKMDGLRDITFTLENMNGANATMTDEIITFNGTGTVKVNVRGKAYNHTFTYLCYDTPEEVRIIDQSTGKEVNELTVIEGGMINYALEAGAYADGVRLEATPDMFRWENNGEMVSVTQNGEVSIKHNGEKTGSVIVSVKGITKEIPIRVIEKSTFSDTKEHWAGDTIEKLVDLNIINGFEENGEKLFKPDNNITRAQFCAIVAKSLGISDENITMQFIDSDEIQEWALPYVNAMAEKGYMNGKSDDGETLYFDPESSITRAEAFAVISRIIGEAKEGEIIFKDKSDIPQWAESGIITLSKLGIINGYDDNTIRPNNTITRAEAVTLVNNSGIIK